MISYVLMTCQRQLMQGGGDTLSVGKPQLNLHVSLLILQRCRLCVASRTKDFGSFMLWALALPSANPTRVSIGASEH